ncbi:MAG: HAD family hydrolase [Lachnospiraceae bacterium]|nr:HAD family hydrolase [Lachnospiraceae bacterium]
MWLCSDLDNTLIYSARHAIGSDRVCVEWYQGREASFMTGFSYRALCSLPETVRFVPVTTRTREQYLRVRFPKEPEFALVCNGGVLLERGAVNEVWYRESLALAAPFFEEKERLHRFLQTDENRCLEVRDIEGLFLFTKSEDPQATLAGMRAIVEKAEHEGKAGGKAAGTVAAQRWILACHGNKVYALPGVFEKGAALKRFCGKYGADRIVAAGDSVFDRSLLAAADVAVTLAGLMRPGETKADGRLVETPADAFLSDRIWDWVEG